MKIQTLNSKCQSETRSKGHRSASVSVAIATYNGERYLPDLLTSICNQSVLPCEVVFADDASSDLTHSIIREFAESAPFPVTLLLQERNVGVLQNFLAAFEYCSGETIAYCDQDDVWLSNKIEICAAALADLSVSLVIHRSFVTDADLKRVGRVVHYNKYRGLNKFPVNSLEIAGYGHQMVFRKSVVVTLLVLRERLHDSLLGIIDNFDKAIPLAASLLGGVTVLSEPLVLFRRHGGSVSPAEKDLGETGLLALVARRFAANRERTRQVSVLWQALGDQSVALSQPSPDITLYSTMLRNVENIGTLRLELELQASLFSRVVSLFKMWKCALAARPKSNVYGHRDVLADVVCAIVGSGHRS